MQDEKKDNLKQKIQMICFTFNMIKEDRIHYSPVF